MQKNKSLALFAFIGLIFGLFPAKGLGKLIWEDFYDNKNVDFSGFNKVFISSTLNSITTKQLVPILKESLAKDVKLVIFQDDENSQQFNALTESRLVLHISQGTTKNPNINYLHLYATAGSEIAVNHSYFVGNVWEKMFFFENKNQLDQDILISLKKIIPLFISQYFKTNFQEKSNLVFYYSSNIYVNESL